MKKLMLFLIVLVSGRLNFGSDRPATPNNQKIEQTTVQELDRRSQELRKHEKRPRSMPGAPVVPLIIHLVDALPFADTDKHA